MSTAPAVKAALFTLWTTALGVTGGGVRRGSRVTISPAERLTIGAAKGASEPITLGPTRQMEENYTVECTLSVTQSGTVDDEPVVTDRLWQLFDLAEVALRSLPGENGGVTGVLLAYVAGDWEEVPAAASSTGGKVNMQLRFNVRVQARYRLALP